ncbi:hypothetical protein G9A89_017987 [Geosiphon pyriformis]|nr:hypothetical protein G9A89_017987 [Geosiphon pyriformis]
MVDSFTGPLSLKDIGSAGIKPVVFWSSKVDSIASSISNLSNVEKMANIVAKETSYVESGKNDSMDKAIPRKICTQTYVLGNLFNLSKSFVLDIELLAVSGKTAKELAICEKIVMNNNLKKISNYSDKEIVVKEIPVNLLRSVIESVFSKFGKIVSIKIQLIGLWQKALVEFEDLHWTLLYTLLVGTTAYDLSDLLESYGRKTCFIGHNLISYVHNRCAIVCFVDEAFKLAAIGSTPVFKDVNLHWAGFSLACCAYCKQFGHIFAECSLDENSGGFSFHKVSLNFSGVGLSSDAKSVPSVSDSHDILKKLSFVELVSLASSLHISPLVVVASVIANMNLDMTLDDITVSFSPPLSAVAGLVVDLSSNSSKVLTTKVGGLESKMVALEVLVESVLKRLNYLCSGLVTLCGNLQHVMFMENVVCWHRDSENLVSIIMETKLRDKFNEIKVFSSGLDKKFLGVRVTIIMNTSLAHHVCKVSEVLGWLLSVKLLFKNKLSVSILGLYAGASLAARFFQANVINSMIAKAVNEFLFVVLGGDFNENGFRKSASFRKCLDFGLVNSLGESMVKTIDFLFISSNLANAVVGPNVFDVEKFFDTDHQTVSVSLGGLLDAWLNFLRKQANRD